MKSFFLIPVALSAVMLITGCANFINLAEDLNFMKTKTILTGRVTNADQYPNHKVRAFVFQWDREKGKMSSMDYAEIEGYGVFGFYVAEAENQYMAAFADTNDNDKFDQGEPVWLHRDERGQPAPVVNRPQGADAQGTLKRGEGIPEDLQLASLNFFKGRTRHEVKTGWSIPIGLGEIASIEEDRFSAEKAAEGYWKPASYPMETGLGIYMTEPYDPNRIPVVFVHGAAGSPQDFRTFFKKFDRKNFQLWFYHYPSGRDLDGMGGALDRGLRMLQSYTGCDEVYVVAHSMGGLVSRKAILDHRADKAHRIGKFVSISSPFGGQEFAATGVKRSPVVVPSWRDIEPGSEFIGEIFSEKLKGEVPHLLIYGDKASPAAGLPDENDGTVSVSSVTYEPAVKDAVKVSKYHEDHMSILSNPKVLREVEAFLRQ